jgi:hypothetical protein
VNRKLYPVVQSVKRHRAGDCGSREGTNHLIYDREWGRSGVAVAVWDARPRLTVGLNGAYACLAKASSEGARHVVISGCVLGEEDVAGVCALPCRAGETHRSQLQANCSKHAQHAGSSRVRRVRLPDFIGLNGCVNSHQAWHQEGCVFAGRAFSQRVSQGTSKSHVARVISQAM